MLFFYHYLYYRCTMCIILSFTLQWRHNERHSVSHHQHHHCLLKRLLTSKLRVTGLCAGNSPGTGEFLAQMASNAENVSIWWRHHDHMHSRASITQQYLTVHNRPNTVWQDQSGLGLSILDTADSSADNPSVCRCSRRELIKHSLQVYA